MPPGVAVSKGEIEQLLCQHKPSMLFMCHGRFPFCAWRSRLCP